MIIGVVDIGTNSVRLLITDGGDLEMRWEEVTGLGRDVDKTRRLSAEAIDATLPALERYGHLMGAYGAGRRAVIATSASRDSSNRESFFDLAEERLGSRPRLLSGDDEARYAFIGATARTSLPGPHLVCDIGGGSTELVTADTQVSVDIGSVRVTERWIIERPVSDSVLAQAREQVAAALAHASQPSPEHDLIGVAGTWTELPGLSHGDPTVVSLTAADVTGVVEKLAGLTIDETRRLPTLNPARARVMLGGALVAEAVMGLVAASRVTVSIRDGMDGVAAELAALA